MNYRELMLENDKSMNRVCVKSLRVSWLFLSAVWLLNEVGLFVVDAHIMELVYLIDTIVLIVMPTIIIDVLKKSNEHTKYILVTIATVSVAVAYAFLTFHAIMLFMFPIVLAALYFDRKLSYFTMGITITLMILSHIASYYVQAISSEPFKEIYHIIVFGLLPRIIEYVALSVIVVILTNKTSAMLKNVFRYSDEVNDNKNGMDAILENTENLFCANNYEEAAEAVITAVEDLLYRFIDTDETIYGVVCVNNDVDGYYAIDNNRRKIKVVQEKNRIIIDSEYGQECIDAKENNSDDNIVVLGNKISLRFYDNGKFDGAVVFMGNFNSKVVLLKNLCSVFYGELQLAIINARLTTEMFFTQESIVRAFAEISESKSKQTGQHIKRVSEYMRVMADALGYTEREKNNLAIASMMHDVGKLMIPEEILEKPGKLTKEEFDIIKLHVDYGYELLKNAPGTIMELGKVIALEHHEKWNGKGYHGKKGEDINYFARIMAIVDVFDALVSRRSYKEGWSPDDAYEEIVSQSGEQFDPILVEVFKANYSRFLEILHKYPDDNGM